MSSLFGNTGDPMTSPSEPSTENPVEPTTSSSEASTAIGTPQKRRRLCLTICTVRKAGLSEEEFGEYLIKVHAQLSKGLLAKYGMIRWTMVGNIVRLLLHLARPSPMARAFPCVVGSSSISSAESFSNSQTVIDLLLRQAHNTNETRSLLPKIYGPNFANVVEYDCFSQAIFEDVDRIASMTKDPYYLEYIRHDPVKFADPKNTKYVGPCISPMLLGILSTFLDTEALSAWSAIFVGGPLPLFLHLPLTFEQQDIDWLA